MSKITAIKILRERLTFFKYIFKDTALSLTSRHLTFDMGKKLPELQMTMDFCESHLDILVFPHPIIVSNDNYNQLLMLVNNINWYCKSNGRFYIDDYGDFAYSLRIKYDVLEQMTDYCIGEIEFAVDSFVDLLEVIFDAATTSDYYTAKENISIIWKSN